MGDLTTRGRTNERGDHRPTDANTTDATANRQAGAVSDVRHRRPLAGLAGARSVLALRLADETLNGRADDSNHETDSTRTKAGNATPVDRHEATEAEADHEAMDTTDHPETRRTAERNRPDDRATNPPGDRQNAKEKSHGNFQVWAARGGPAASQACQGRHDMGRDRQQKITRDHARRTRHGAAGW
jgi:hypothetical protein